MRDVSTREAHETLPQVGALVAGFVFGAVSNQAKFYISAACGLVGLVRQTLNPSAADGQHCLPVSCVFAHACRPSGGSEAVAATQCRIPKIPLPWIQTGRTVCAQLVTLAFIPDLTGMDLVEGDRFWLHAIEGRCDFVASPFLQALSLDRRISIKNNTETLGRLCLAQHAKLPVGAMPAGPKTVDSRRTTAAPQIPKTCGQS